jgi:hypothetical protein
MSVGDQEVISRFPVGYCPLHPNVSLNGVTPDDHHVVPYQQAHLSAYRFAPARPRGTIVVFGGYDSYIEEWLPAALALRAAPLYLRRLLDYTHPARGPAQLVDDLLSGLPRPCASPPL